MSDKKLDLIAQLLAKAESTTPEEAEALTEAAERLMLKYGIEQAVIDERRARSGQVREEIIEIRMPMQGTYSIDLRDLGAQVAFGLGTIRPLVSKYGNVHVLYLVGFESDVRQAELLVESLKIQALVAMRAWWARERDEYWYPNESAKRSARSSFIRGFGEGARARIQANRQQIVEEAGSGTDLVLASRLDRIRAHLGEIPKARGRRGKADAWAHADGRADGLKAATGERAVTQRKALTA